MSFHRGISEYRYEQNPLEKRFADLWEKQNLRSNTLNYILNADPTERPDEASTNDQIVAATVIQWLGSPVGQAFLEEVLDFDVRSQIPKELLDVQD